MTTAKSQFVQQTLAAITLVLVLGALSMIWPAIIGLFLGVLLLLQSCGAEQEIAVLSWTEVGNLPTVFASLRRPTLPAILS
jgi:phage-related minor tail protein